MYTGDGGEDYEGMVKDDHHVLWKHDPRVVSSRCLSIRRRSLAVYSITDSDKVDLSNL